MSKIFSKIIYVLGIFTLIFGIYVTTFYFARNKAIRPFEPKNNYKTNIIRPAYNLIYYPLRKFVANEFSFKAETQDVYYGFLEKPLFMGMKEKNHRSVAINLPYSLTLDDQGSSTMIGFTGKQSDLKKLDEIKYGSYVRVVFGVALSKKHDRSINRLISFEVIDLMDDPRIKDENFSKEEKEKIEADYDNLEGEAKTCGKIFLDSYKKQVLEHCLQAGYADHIGGGCFHLVPYSVTDTVIKHSLDNCTTR